MTRGLTESVLFAPKPRVQSSSLCAPAKENPRNPHKHLGSEDFFISVRNPDYVYKITVFPSFSPTFRKEKVSTWCQNRIVEENDR